MPWQVRNGSKWILAAAIACASIGASAGSNVLYDGTVTADALAAAPLGITTTLGDPNGGDGGGLLTGDISFDVATPGAVQISLTDLGTTMGATPLAGSVYEVILDGVSIGTTSATAIGASVFSSGSFISTLTAGTHDLGIWDFVSTYSGAGDASPDGGGTVTSDYSQADVSVQVTAVPEPGTLALMGLGIALLATAARRNRAARHVQNRN